MQRQTASLAFMACLLALWATLLFACSGDKKAEKVPTPVKIMAVDYGQASSGYKYSASLTAKEQVSLAFKVGGYVEEILALPGPDGVKRDVQPGDHVTAGAVLARIRLSDYQAQVSQAKASLGEAQAMLTQANLDYKRASDLYKGNFIAKSEFDQATENLNVTRSRVDNARSALQSMEIQLGDTTLKSPMDCVVVKRSIERGTLASPGNEAFVLANLLAVKAVFGIPDTALALVKTGDSLSVVVEALNNRSFPGTVLSVSPSANAKDRVFNVEVQVQNPGYDLKEGMIATVALSQAQIGPDLATDVMVPLSAVVRPPAEKTGYQVFVVEDKGGKLSATGRRVELGPVKGDKVAVLKGLNQGERVVVSGATVVTEGDIVNVIP